ALHRRAHAAGRAGEDGVAAAGAALRGRGGGRRARRGGHRRAARRIGAQARGGDGCDHCEGVEMEYQTLKVSHVDGASWITLDRPPVNAATVQLLEELLHAMDALEARDETRCIVLTGAGTKAFCAGADISAGSGSKA